MGTTVISFIAGCMVGAMLTACGGGSDEVGQGGEPAVIVCKQTDRGCMQHGAAVKSRVCQVMPSGLLIYLGDEVNDAWLGDDLTRAGAFPVGSWVEGDDCA